jgi:hypothetical protein
MIKLSKKLSIDSIEYASQGNAILGIRDSGKSYTATYIAERLMDDNIPIIAFDPIGIWRYLKIGNGGKGYPVVVAGDNGDLPLTPESAVNIVRAAMKENVSLVVDLYSMSLSKADWRKIVESCIRLLLYENKPCGLRHIFIEEAAEFCPQRVQPENGKVYAEIEKLARMGGNASLGYTLINQRAEEVNKAVLELCDCLFLHRQKGRHSLTALGKWLDVADAGNSKEIINSLPSLDQGETWVWLQGSHIPEKVKIPKKTTVHPDRKHPLKIAPGAAVDVSAFVEKMNKFLTKPKEITAKVPAAASNKEIQHAQTEIKKQYDQAIRERDKRIKDLEECVRSLQGQLKRIHQLSEIVKEESSPGPPLPVVIPTVAYTRDDRHPKGESNGIIPTGPHKMLKVLAMIGQPITKERLSMLSGYSITSSTFGIYIGKLKEMGYARSEGNELSITDEGQRAVGDYEQLPTDPESLISFWTNKLPAGPAKMFNILTSHYPKQITRERLSEESGYSMTSSTFGIYIGKLKTLRLAVDSNKMLKAADELYN